MSARMNTKRLTSLLKRTFVVMGIVVLGSVEASADACQFYAQIYTPNWIRATSMRSVCLDDRNVRLDGNKQRLDGVLTLPNGTKKRFSVVDSSFGRVQVRRGYNAYSRGAPMLDQFMAYYHIKWMYQRIYDLGFAETHLPDTLTIDVHGSHTNAYFKPDENLITLGYVQNGNDGTYYWYGADGEVVLHELGHAIVNQVQPEILTVQGAAIHEAYADYIASTMNGDPCVGEYASFIHDELRSSRNPYRWRCTRTLNESSSRRSFASSQYHFHSHGARQGETNFHRNSLAVSYAAFSFRYYVGADVADRLMLHALQGLEVDLISAADDGEVIKPRLADWYTAMVNSDQLLYNGANTADLRWDASYSRFTQYNQTALLEDVQPNNDLENKIMPWVSWANHLRSDDGTQWLASDDGFFWSAFLNSGPGSAWHDGLKSLPTPNSSQWYQSFSWWTTYSGLEARYHPGQAWNDWLASPTGVSWISTNVEPAWRAFTEKLWRAFMDNESWRAYLDTKWRAYYVSMNRQPKKAQWEAFAEEAMLQLIYDDAAWRALMSDDAWRAMLDEAWRAYADEAKAKTGSQWRAWRALAQVKAGWRAFGEMEQWRAYLADGWRAFSEDNTAWRAMMDDSAWRAYIDDSWRAYNGWVIKRLFNNESLWRKAVRGHRALQANGGLWRAFIARTQGKAFDNADAANSSGWRAWRAWRAWSAWRAWRAWRAFASEEDNQAAYDAYQAGANAWRAYLDANPKWRAFVEKSPKLFDAWRAMHGFDNDGAWRAWRAYSEGDQAWLSFSVLEPNWRSFLASETQHQAWAAWRSFRVDAWDAWRDWRDWGANHSRNEWRDMAEILDTEPFEPDQVDQARSGSNDDDD